MSKEWDIAWIELNWFGCIIYSAVIYISQDNSRYGNYVSIFRELEMDIKFFREGHVVVMGDMNARIGHLFSKFFIKDEKEFELKRSFMDSNATVCGKELIDMMNACNDSFKWK